MKKLVSLFLTIFCVSCFCVTANADEVPLLVDNYGDDGYFTKEEFDEISEKLQEVSDKYDSDVIIRIESKVYGDVEEYAFEVIEEYLDETDGEDGVLLLIAVDSRDYWFITKGECEYAFDSFNFDLIEDKVVEKLKDDDFYGACITYAEYCDEIIPDAGSNRIFARVKMIGIFLIIGVVIALVVCLCLKSQLKSVKTERSANNYVKKGSFDLTTSNDLFLYKNVTKVKRQSSSSGGGGGRSGGGHSGGSRGGKF